MNLKRFITDNAERPKGEPLPTTRKEKIAVIGAGPSGLTAALELRKRGYPVTVFEELPEAGGMLRWGIPAYRLPREELDREIKEIIDTGIDLRTNVKIGRDLSLKSIEKEFDMIYLAVGDHKSLPLNIPGEEAEGVIGAVEFLRAYHLGQEVKVGKHVAVIGGGNSAIDAARTALRLGAKKATLYYRRERKDMPAQEWEIKAAEEEGVRIIYLVAPVRVITQYGRATHLELTQMRLDRFDRSGRREPKPIMGSEFKEKAETVISAISQTADLKFLGKRDGVEITGSGVKVDKALRTTHSKIWAGGDLVTGPAMVIDAVKAGQDAARNMDRTIREARGEKPWAPPPEEAIEIPFEVDQEPAEQPQTSMPEISPGLRARDFREVETGYTLEMAMTEARRCMRCDARIE
jgi:NADPH-dependent glutamate synthase beta subunit-like oxidoreductase